MRLIDADNLDKYDWGHLKEVSKEALFLIETEPTVDAIPIEWIEKWCGNEPYWSNLAMHLIDDWEKENARD